MMKCAHCGSVLSAVTWTCVRGAHCPGPEMTALGLPSAERSARQAAAAREGPTGKLRARKPQRDPGGMFDLPLAERRTEFF